ncbi:MAG: EamA family transporter [Anaerolineae bacterium]|nr:EamA family transporter [Anaerolineae bacterium]
MLTDNQRPRLVYPALALWLLAVSISPIIVRLAQGEALPSLFIAAARLTLSALILTPLTLRGHRAELAALMRRDLLLAVITGVILAIHFITWIYSLEFTSVLISVVFVTTSPLWVALIEVVFLKMHIRRSVLVGLLIAVAGGLLIGVGGESDTTAGSNPLLGGGLALVGAIAFATYLVLGRKLRPKLSLLPYIWLVYGFAAIFLVTLALIMQIPMSGYSTTGYLWVVALAIFPQLLGHSSFNYVLRYLSATYVGIASQIEPIGSTLIAYVVFGELPLPLQIVGSLAILGGVAIATLVKETTVANAAVEAAEDSL